jgi:hypothetical protein
LAGKLAAEDLQRFMAFILVQPETGCWVWTGCQDQHGYGQFWWGNRMHWAHRWAVAAFREPVPANHDADHIDACRNPSCVNPAHVRITHRVAHGTRHSAEGVEARHHQAAAPF